MMAGIFLIGFMGAGKTTIGKKLAAKTKREHIDFDEVIVDEIGMSIQAYFDQFGEEAFRQKETAVLKRLLASEEIVSTGGGIVLQPENRGLLQTLPNVVYLKTETNELMTRLKNDQTNIRPLVVSKSPEEIAAVYLPRIPLYEKCATLTIETTGKAPTEIVAEILAKVGV